MNVRKIILSLSASGFLFLGACSNDSSTDAIFTSKDSVADSADVEKKDPEKKRDDAKSSSSAKAKSSSSFVINAEDPDLDDDSDVKSSSSEKTEAKSSISEGIVIKSSSSEKIEPKSSSSEKIEAKSSSSPKNEAWGDCSSNVKNNIAAKGSEVTWSIVPKKGGPISDVTDMASLRYTWTFQGGSPDSVYSNEQKSAKTIYNVSGTFTTTVTMTLGTTGESQVVQCPTLEVTGAAVTGCTCKAAKPAADISEGVSWTVSGCISEDQNFTYTWSEPFQSETTAVLSGSVAAKGLYKPTVRVKNGANGLMDVTCDEIAVSDKNIPDYIIKAVLDDGAIKLPAGKTSVSLEVDPFNKTVFCTVARVDSPSGAVNGTVNGVKLAGADYVAVPVPNLTKGTMINFELDVPATCGVH